MLCQNCGRQVEFIGNVCAWCGAPKMQSQAAHFYFYIWGFLGLCLGGFIGNLVEPEAGAFFGALIGGVILGVIGYNKGTNAFNQNVSQNVSCPHCKADLVVNRAAGPNYTCANCGGTFHLNAPAVGGRGRPDLNGSQTECPHCGYRTSFNIAQNPDKYCANCGKRFGG